MSKAELVEPAVYERVLGKAEKPADGPNESDSKAENAAHEKTRKDIFFEGLFELINNPIFVTIVMAAVLFNTMALILLTFPEMAARISYGLLVLDSFFLAVYLAEAVIKITALGFSYFESGWNLLDFFILLTSVVDFIVLFLTGLSAAAGSSFLKITRLFRAMRALRALRMLRTITLLHNLQVIIKTVLKSINSMTVVFSLMLLFLYMFAVMGRQLYAAASPTYFGDLFRAITSMFQVLTLDSWFAMYEDMNPNTDNPQWHFILFVIAYSLVEYFILLNLFTAVLVDNFQDQLKSRTEDTKMKAEIKKLDKEDHTEKVTVANYQTRTIWPQGRPTMHYNPYLEDIGHLPLDSRIMYVQFYNILCSLDYQAYMQKQNYLMMYKLLDKCQDPRLLHNSQADEE